MVREAVCTSSESSWTGDITPEARSFLYGLIGLSLVMGLSVGYARLVTTMYAVKLDAQGWMLAAVALSQSIGMVVLAAAAGRWVDAHGARPVFALGSAWGMLICLLTPLVPALPALLLFTAAGSLAMPPRFVSINTLFMSRLQDMGLQRVGWFRAAHVTGMSFLGALLATAVFPVFGPLTAFWCAAGIFALNIVVFLAGVGRHEARSTPVRQAQVVPGGRQRQKHSAQARRVALWEFSIQSLNAYFAFYIVVVVLRYLQLPAYAAGLSVAVQGASFVGALLAAGHLVNRRPGLSRRLGVALVLGALAALATAWSVLGVGLGAAMLGGGLGLLQTLNLAAFANLGERIGFSRAAAINALSGPCGGAVGGLLGGLAEPWVKPQSLFLAFVPLFGLLAFTRQGEPVAEATGKH